MSAFFALNGYSESNTVRGSEYWQIIGTILDQLANLHSVSLWYLVTLT